MLTGERLTERETTAIQITKETLEWLTNEPSLNQFGTKTDKLEEVIRRYRKVWEP